MVLTQSCGRPAVGALLATVWGQSAGTVRQRLREWLYEAAATQGRKRGAVAVRSCLAPLLAGVLPYWPACAAQLALVLDATLLRDRWAVLVGRGVSRGCARPVVWTVVRCTPCR